MKRPVVYLIIVTLLLGALQLAWSLEFTQATPYLLSLGVPAPILSLVWLAGPLSGAIGQPIIGMISDNTHTKWGKRRPFILLGCVLTIISLISLSHVRIIWIACLLIYCLDFSIQVIQASTRALIADIIDHEQQEHANAWGGRMIAGFNIFGFLLSSIDLSNYGDQFQVLSILVSCLMFFMTFIICCCISESSKPPTERKPVSWDSLITAWNDMNQTAKLVCWVEGFAWLGYFPLLFYTTAYVGQLYVKEMGYFNDVPDWVIKEGTRRGSMALLANGIMSLITVTIGPHLVFLSNIVNLWKWSHLIFILGAISTVFIDKSIQAIILFGILGIPWGCATWIPFVLINQNVGEEAGVVLGIHNVFVCLPQMISSILCSLIFYFVDDGMKWAFTIMGIFTLGAWILTNYII